MIIGYQDGDKKRILSHIGAPRIGRLRRTRGWLRGAGCRVVAVYFDAPATGKVANTVVPFFPDRTLNCPERRRTLSRIPLKPTPILCLSREVKSVIPWP